jgi:hypothetical protein
VQLQHTGRHIIGLLLARCAVRAFPSGPRPVSVNKWLVLHFHSSALSEVSELVVGREVKAKGALGQQSNGMVAATLPKTCFGTSYRLRLVVIVVNILLSYSEPSSHSSVMYASLCAQSNGNSADPNGLSNEKQYRINQYMTNRGACICHE